MELVPLGVEKLLDRLSQEYEQFQGVEDQVAELQSNLNLLKAFLKDADAKKHTNEMVRHCVEEIKEIVYDAEDIIETCILKEIVGKKIGIMKRIRRFACTIVDRRELASDIGGISKRILKVIQDMKIFGVKEMITDGRRSSHSVQEIQRQMRQEFPRSYESDLVGMEANVKKLVGYLVEEDDIQLVSITGMGGLGKTTLARQVFNHEDVKRQFDGHAWVSVSQDFIRNNVWQKILGDLKPKEEEKKILEMTESTLQGELTLLLETSKSLIVLDDIWEKQHWDLIKPIFQSKKGWKVLLTSRNESVTMHGDMTYINFKPEFLTIEDSRTLFQRIVMPKKDAPEIKIMEEMANEMIKHCGGLPLAVKVLGGLLAAKYKVDDWKRLSKNIGSHLVRGITDNYVLSLSFEELPSDLKHCFLYLAHFPEDYKINLEKLSYYWAAERIFEHRQYDGKTIRDVGDSYIEELVRRNMVISERDATTLRFETCHLHDLMREVCLLKAREENFVHIVDTANSQSPCKSRRIAVNWNPIDETYHPEGEMMNPKLRSLLIIKKQFRGIKWMASSLCFTRLQWMRVLDLSYAEFEGGKLPSSIGKLIHLRYLSLFYAKVTHLPSSMRNLKQLLYLNLYVDLRYLLYMPNFLKEMRELTYFCLPRGIHEKTKLVFSNLVNLEKLENFSTKNSCVRDLQRMTKLRTLSIVFRGEGCATETLSSSLSKLSCLEYLTISLQACRLVEDPMPILEKLVQLKELNLWRQSFCGSRMVCSSGGFPQLQELLIEGLEEWEEWIVEKGFMPLLHTLEICYCEKLKKLPAGGFSRLQNLKLKGLKEWEEWIVEEGFMPLLHFLSIRKCPKLKKLHVGGLPQLQKLFLSELEELEEWIVEEGSMPLLHTLKILDCKKLKKLHVGGFLQLHMLDLDGLEKWEEWTVEEGSMPLLHSLNIRHCPKLKELPDGLRFIYSLKDLRMDKEWEERLSRGEDYYKVKHIPFVKFY